MDINKLFIIYYLNVNYNVKNIIILKYLKEVEIANIEKRRLLIIRHIRYKKKYFSKEFSSSKKYTSPKRKRYSKRYSSPKKERCLKKYKR